ncbi:uncharacterized protein LOC142158668 isoform X3 [Mixophyes fleayi]|uniref:uncharacterized protein LOC142158668 isoform X3 n=1 Tax=Mixophyes fleayi TaxID=3061075 RepID=UPI003F4DA3D2
MMGDRNAFLQSTAQRTQNNFAGNQNVSFTKQNPDAKRNRFSCPGCDFSCNSFQNFKIHLQQTNHETVEKVVSQNMSTLNKPENQNLNSTKEPEFQKINVTKISENQKMNTTKYPEMQKMNTTMIPENQKMNIIKIPEIQKMNITIPETQKMNTTKYPEIQKMNITKISETQKMNTTKYPEIQKINITKVPEPQKINTTKYPETQKMNTTKNPETPKMNTTKNPGNLSEHIRRSIFYLSDYMRRTDREPLIGLEYVLEYRVQNKANRIEPKYVCELCELDTELVPMVEHLAGFRHRKLYLAREYPYVLKAQSSSKEDKSQFMRRMALEIEREEGTKMYKVDTAVKMESLNLKTSSANQSKRKTRWDIEGNSQTRMKKALEYLESFEIDNDIEATTVTRLTDKLTDDVKYYSNKLKEEALFPVRVARAKDVAMSLMQNISRERMGLQNPVQQNQMPPPTNRGPQENANRQSGLSGPNTHGIDKTKMAPSTPIPQNPQQFPFVPTNQKQNNQSIVMPNTVDLARKAENAQSSHNDASTEDIQFLKKLMTLLKCLPQNTSSAENVQMNSKLMMLKSLMLDQTPSTENPQKSQKMMMQVASLTQDTANTDVSLNQQLMMLMTSQNTSAMEKFQLSQQTMMQMSSMAKKTMSLENSQLNQSSMVQMAGVIQNSQNSGNVLMNKNLQMPLSQNQEYGQMGRSSMTLMDHVYQGQNMEVQPEYASTSHNYGGFGYDRSVEKNYLPHADPYVSRFDNVAVSGVYRANEQTHMPYSDMSYESGMRGTKWNNPPYGGPSVQVADPVHVNRAGGQAPYTRVCLSPSVTAPLSNTRDIHNSRPFDAPENADRESNVQHSKRARLDMDHIPSHFSEKNYNHGSLKSSGINTAGLSADLLKRIQGKDLFTVSAILGEYADNKPSK